MTNRILLLTGGLLFSSLSWADQLLVFTFLESRPFQGLEISLDGQPLGTTSSTGEASGALTPGAHTLVAAKNDATLAEYDFVVAAGESAEISISFSDFKTPPEIAIALFDAAGDSSALTGILRGTVVDAAGIPVVGASISAEGVDRSVVTGREGGFSLELPRGERTLVVSHPSFETLRQSGLRIVANVGLATSITLRERSQTELTDFDFADAEEVLVMGTYKPAADAADIEKFSVAITDAISIDDLLRSGDSDVAAALKRIVGVSVTGGKYAVVRGLDGRYISSTLNGTLMPSTDPFRRDVQLDLFPANILGGIEIQKSFSADLPGETTGGIIKMTTRGMPEEDSHGLSASLGLVTGVTGDDLLSYAGGGSDDFGFDDGTRELPGAINAATSGGRDFGICQIEGQSNCVSREEAVRLAGLLPNIYNPGSESAAPGLGLSYKRGQRWEREGGALGVYGTASYDSSSASRQHAFIDDVDRDTRYSWDVQNRSLNGYLVAGYQADAGWDLLSKTLWLRDAEDRTTVEQGFDKNEDRNIHEVVLEWVERQFLGQQFEAGMDVFGDHRLRGRLGITQTERFSPDRREYLYIGDFLALSSLERSYAELTENGLDLGLDYDLPVNFSDNIYTMFRFGLLSSSRDRDNELVRLGVRQGRNTIDLNADVESLLRIENFENDAFRLNAKSTVTDSYSAEQTTTALYLSSETDIGQAWTIVAGARLDDYSIELDFPNAPDVRVDRDDDALLPALSLIYRSSDAWQFRFGYSATVSRPNITELAPSRFYDQFGRLYIGCPSCIEASIDNLDFRAEYYFGDKDSLSLALFHKDISNPMERSVADGSGSATDALTFRNSQGATVSGFEFDISKRLHDGIDNVLNASLNLALIDSEIELDATGRRLEADPMRELQGQSPLLANLQLGWDHYPGDQQLTLLLNYFDDRIDIVTRNLPSIYEAGQVQLNLNYEKEFRNASRISLKVKNLLDAKTEYTQGGRVIESYSKGIALSLGYAMDF